MTIEEFINLGNKLSSLHVGLTNNKNIDLWIAFRTVRDKGHLMDIQLYTTNTKKKLLIFSYILPKR